MSVRPTEYAPGAPLERYSAERRRRGITAASAGYGTAATGAAMAGTTLGNLKIAGTGIGQATLHAGEAKLRRAGHPGAEQVAQLRHAGKWAARHRVGTTAGVGGLITAGAGLGAMSRLRANEEAGISQGIGRIKAGESYRATQSRALSKGMLRAALMASDTDLDNPALRRTAGFVHHHRRKVAAGMLAAGGTGVGVGTVIGGRNRVAQTGQLRAVNPVKKAVDDRHPVQTAGLLGGSATLGAGAARLGTYENRFNAHVDRKHQRLQHEATRSLRIAPNARTGTAAARKIHSARLSELRALQTADRTAFRVPHAGRGGRRAALATGAGLFGLQAARTSNVGKLYVKDERTSIPHLAGFGIGAALLAGGIGRSGMVGRALSHGIRSATHMDNGFAVQALQRAQMAQGVLRRATAPGEHAMRQIRAVDQAVNRVPAAIRPEIAMAAGALLINRSTPLRSSTYHPVNIRIRSHY